MTGRQKSDLYQAICLIILAIICAFFAWKDAYGAEQLPFKQDLNPPPNVVRVWVMETDGLPAYGTGALIGPGLIITNNHVVRGRESDESVKVIFPDWVVYDAYVVHTDKENDLAAVKLRINAHVEPLAIGPMVEVGDTVAFFGYGSGLPDWESGPVTHWGVTQEFTENGRRVETDVEFGPIIEVDAPAHSGDSGSPYLDSKGRYVGTLFGSDGTTSMGAHVDTVLKFLGWTRENPPKKVKLY